MSPYFPEPRPQPPEHAPYWCPWHEAWYRVRRGMDGVRCAVAHSPGTCCHYNEERVEIRVVAEEPPPTPEQREAAAACAEHGVTACNLCNAGPLKKEVMPSDAHNATDGSRRHDNAGASVAPEGRGSEINAQIAGLEERLNRASLLKFRVGLGITDYQAAFRKLDRAADVLEGIVRDALDLLKWRGATP